VDASYNILNKNLVSFQHRGYTILHEPFSFSGSLNRFKKERKWPLRVRRGDEVKHIGWKRKRLRSVHAEFSSSAQTQSHHLIGTCNKFRCSGCTQLNCLATAACEGECNGGRVKGDSLKEVRKKGRKGKHIKLFCARENTRI